MSTIVDIFNSKTITELNNHKANYSSVDTAREVISGSIFQVAYVAIKQYAKPKKQSEGALRFESEINRLIQEKPAARIKNFTLPQEFCVGREIGDIPIGLIIFAARNQYNHFYEKRLNVVNEVIFNYLNMLWPDPPNDLSFDLYDESKFYSFSALSTLNWTDEKETSAYTKYKKDISDILKIKF